MLPILWRDTFIGRLDSKADRKTKNLIVKKLWFEPGFQAFDESFPALSKALAQFARFNGCNTIEFHSIIPTGHKRRLKTLVKRSLGTLSCEQEGEP